MADGYIVVYNKGLHWHISLTLVVNKCADETAEVYLVDIAKR